MPGSFQNDRAIKQPELDWPPPSGHRRIPYCDAMTAAATMLPHRRPRSVSKLCEGCEICLVLPIADNCTSLETWQKASRSRFLICAMPTDAPLQCYKTSSIAPILGGDRNSSENDKAHNVAISSTYAAARKRAWYSISQERDEKSSPK